MGTLTTWFRRNTVESPCETFAFWMLQRRGPEKSGPFRLWRASISVPLDLQAGTRTMPRPEAPTIAVAIRTFGNSRSHEGLRVKAGTRFAIGKALDGLPLLTDARFKALRDAGLVRGINDADLVAAPGARALAQNVRYAEQGPGVAQNLEAEANEKKASEVAPTAARPTNSREKSRRRTQETEPPAPAPLTNSSLQKHATSGRRGSKTGAILSSSSSPEDQALKPLTSRQRGTRRG